ncbi:MAG TPA: fumarylacetoacetate hydrolase family protein [Polyangia bacterium]|nr:fumarylacetoacetate hydrolase family protein [Polyangia bacterium]
MRLATLRDGTRDGELVVVTRDGRRCAPATEIAPSLQAALDGWNRAGPLLSELAARLDGGAAETEPLDETRLGPPLPRAYEWVDGSAYLTHVRLVRKARGAEPPPTLETDPLVYQGGSGALLGPRDPIPLPPGPDDPGLDLEAEVAVILGDVASGTTVADAPACVRLVMLANDVTLRNVVPGELAKGFGFFQSKPATAFSPFAVTPDELGSAWRDGRLHLPLRSSVIRAGGGRLDSDPDAGAMHFGFFDLIAHIARTRDFCAGTILGGGTVSNEDPARGASCLAELRARETIAAGRPSTPFLSAGDRVTIGMQDATGRDLFGRIDQTVKTLERG